MSLGWFGAGCDIPYIEDSAYTKINKLESIVPKLQLYSTTDKNLSLDNLLRMEPSFEDLDSTFQFQKNTTYWLRFKADSDLDNSRSNVDFFLPTVEYSINTLYYQENGKISESRISRTDGITKEGEFIPFRYHQFKLNPLEDGYFYLKVKDSFYPKVLGPGFVSIFTESEFRLRQFYIQEGMIGYASRTVLLLGGITFLLIYILGMYLLNKEPLYLYYSVYLLVMMLYLGVKLYPNMTENLFGFYPSLNLAWNEVTQMLISFWYLRFARAFLEAKEHYPLFDKAAIVAEWIILGFIAVFVTLFMIDPNSEVLYPLTVVQRLLMIGFSVISMIYIILKIHNHSAYFIIFGSSALLIGSVVALVLESVQYFLVGVLTEVILFAMGLGYLMKQKDIERAYLSNEIERIKMTALQTQMNPHFIFNSLNSIRAYMISNKTKEASSYLSKFSKLIRQILEYSNEERIPLAQELETLQLYVHLEQLRFRERFELGLNIDPSLDLEDIMVPPLLVQPFIENAIWHGLMKKEGEKNIEIAIRDENEVISIIVRDNGIGRKAAQQKKEKMGVEKKSMAIELTRKRLHILNFKLHDKEPVKIFDLYDSARKAAGTEVKITLPKISKK